MDYHGRRGRHGRCHSNHAVRHSFSPPPPAKTSSFWNSLVNFVMLASLIAVVCLTMEYHCETCSTKSNVSAITKNLEEIANNLTLMKDNYYELETKITQFSKELPKIEGQIEVLEALANTMEQNQLGWNQRSQFCSPHLDVSCGGDSNMKNVSKSSVIRCHRPIRS